ncbi:hypothetical protein F5887DRAFT_249636 [Amanita rubescens]|nr:hypothetical protein F5887DRAFT_523288 [Amanita rubescens]KAF8344698.1 hypothetical protein F5887DRAFT_249636 [Amanita rubescens]
MNDFDVVDDSEGEELEFGPSKATRALSSIETAETGDDGQRRVSSVVTASLGASLTVARRHELDASTMARMPNMDFVDFPDSLSIADRAKTRQRSTRQPSLPMPGPSARVSHPFDEGTPFDSYHVPDMLGDDDSEDFAASRSKSKPKQKKPVEIQDSLRSSNVGNDPNPALPAADIHISGRGQFSPPPPQSRPKPRPIKRTPKTINVEPPWVETTNQEQQPTSQLSLPVPTSPLPPSDPPPPSTMLNDHGGSMPPIVTLPDPPSSPSSLFSIGDKGAGDTHIPSVEDDPLLMGPPSTFFTGSSSSDPPPQPPQQQRESRGKISEAVDFIDLCTAPPQSMGVQILAVKKTTSSKKGKEKEQTESRGAEKSKNKAKGKRKARDEEEFEFDLDGEDEYEESGKVKKSKTAASKRGKEKKAAASKKVVARTKSTQKRSGKETTKEAPGREDNPECRPQTSTPSDKAPVRPPDLSTADNNLGEAGAPPNFVPDSEGEDMVGPRSVIAAPKSSGKKRRNLVTYDEDDEAGGQEEESSSPKKKARTRRGTQANVKKDTLRLQPEKIRSGKVRQKGKRVVSSDEEEDGLNDDTVRRRKKGAAVLSSDDDAAAEDESTKENVHPRSSGTVGSTTSSSPKPKPPPPKPVPNHDNDNTTVKPVSTSLTSRYTIAPKTKLTPMSELIRRVNSLPQTPTPIGKDKAPSVLRPASGVAYSPYTKSSRSFLSKIAPLHPNRRTPPPPPPPPPPRKKSKKEIEREERWEEELIENVGGPAAWSCLSKEERKEMRRGKWAMEMGFDD